MKSKARANYYLCLGSSRSTLCLLPLWADQVYERAHISAEGHRSVAVMQEGGAGRYDGRQEFSVCFVN